MAHLSHSTVPSIRVRIENDAPVRTERAFVLYWMIAARRLDSNFALQRAVEWSRELDRPLVILEALRIGYRWASERLHRFCMDGMWEHARRLDGTRVTYLPYVEPSEGEGKGLLEALGSRASVVVTDEFPSFFLPRAVEAAGRALDVRLEVVDGNGLLPMAATEEPYKSAYHFRRFLQKSLPEHLYAQPVEHPLLGDPLPTFEERGVESPRTAGRAGDADRIPIDCRIEGRWPLAGRHLLEPDGSGVAGLGLDDEVGVVEIRGGATAASERLEAFVADDLARYAEKRNDPDADVTSRLSPYLHWGHISAHQIVRAVSEAEGWTPSRLATTADGSRHGWWGMSESAEEFLDQVVTWRELGFVFNHHVPDYDSYETLPEWARETLEAHESDRRPHLYDLEEFEGARTHDELWNAAQRQLRTEGRVHNYLRMLWGKKILEWSPTARDALSTMIALNDRWALDGRDPNSYSGIFWCLGRFDRGWPEREVFGKVRSMTSRSTRRKVSVDVYLERYGDQISTGL